MALAETARLVTELQLKDQLTPGLQKARAELAGTGKAVGGLAGGVTAVQAPGSRLHSLTTGLSGAFSTFKSRITGLVSGPLGILGLGAGLFTLGGAISDGIHMAQ